jgi:hypothetical protein
MSSIPNAIHCWSQFSSIRLNDDEGGGGHCMEHLLESRG